MEAQKNRQRRAGEASSAGRERDRDRDRDRERSKTSASEAALPALMDTSSVEGASMKRRHLLMIIPSRCGSSDSLHFIFPKPSSHILLLHLLPSLIVLPLLHWVTLWDCIFCTAYPSASTSLSPVCLCINTALPAPKPH